MRFQIRSAAGGATAFTTDGWHGCRLVGVADRPGFATCSPGTSVSQWGRVGGLRLGRHLRSRETLAELGSPGAAGSEVVRTALLPAGRSKTDWLARAEMTAMVERPRP
jgi:hypothetical protein